MRFHGYDLRLTTDGSIFFDEELTPAMLRVEDGDKFEIIFVDGLVCLRKIRKE